MSDEPTKHVTMNTNGVVVVMTEDGDELAEIRFTSDVTWVALAERVYLELAKIANGAT